MLISPELTIASVGSVPAFIVKAEAEIVPLAPKPVPLTVIACPGEAEAGVTVIALKAIVSMKLADFSLRSSSVTITL
jgi:hypothetical protein